MSRAKEHSYPVRYIIPLLNVSLLRYSAMGGQLLTLSPASSLQHQAPNPGFY
jgi:hypothetical protein